MRHIIGASMKIHFDSYYLLALYLPAVYCFYLLATWLNCKPINQIDEYNKLFAGVAIPADATCFTDNHLHLVVFHSYPAIENNLIQFSGLLLLTACILALLFRPTTRLFRSTRLSYFTHR